MIAETNKAMKRILLILALWPILCNGQKYGWDFRELPPPAIYISYQPTDHGIGIRGDYHFTPIAGVYASGSYGQWGLYKASGLDKHIKATIGFLIPYKDYMGNQHDFTMGLNYHYMSGQVEPSHVFQDNDLFHTPWSIEVGLTIKFKRFCLGMRTDVPRWEPCIDVGIPL